MNIAPYHLTEAEWNRRLKKAREGLAGNYVQCRATRRAAASMITSAAEIDFLFFGIPNDQCEALKCFDKGNHSISEFGRLRLIALIERPVTYARVRIKAKRLGLI